MLKAKNISKTFKKDIRALKDVSLNLEPGEILGLIGPNGAGKTTFVKICVGVLNRDGGNIEVLGMDPITSLKKISKDFSWIPQDGTRKLSTFLTGREIITLYSLYRGLSKQFIQDRLDYLLETIAPKRDFIDKKISVMSGGQHQLCNILIGLIPQTKLIFCDEISVSLDPIIISNIYNYLRTFVKNGNGVLLTSQNLEEIETLSDRVALLHKGNIVEIGKPRELSKKLLKYELIDLKFDDNLENINEIDSLINKLEGIVTSTEKDIINNMVRIRVNKAYDVVSDIIDILKELNLAPAVEVGKPNLVDAIKRLEEEL